MELELNRFEEVGKYAVGTGANGINFAGLCSSEDLTDVGEAQMVCLSE